MRLPVPLETLMQERDKERKSVGTVHRCPSHFFEAFALPFIWSGQQQKPTQKYADA